MTGTLPSAYSPYLLRNAFAVFLVLGLLHVSCSPTKARILPLYSARRGIRGLAPHPWSNPLVTLLNDAQRSIMAITDNHRMSAGHPCDVVGDLLNTVNVAAQSSGCHP